MTGNVRFAAKPFDRRARRTNAPLTSGSTGIAVQYNPLSHLSSSTLEMVWYAPAITAAAYQLRPKKSSAVSVAGVTTMSCSQEEIELLTTWYATNGAAAIAAPAASWVTTPSVARLLVWGAASIHTRIAAGGDAIISAPD